MKKVLFEIVVPAVVLALWMITCYSVCCKVEGFDYFIYWILVGCPYGIIGGLIGGIVVIMRIAKIFTEIIKVIGGHFWTQCPKE